MEALDNGILSLTDQIPCSENASSMGGSQIWLDTTETLTVDEMLKAICVVSANDCCVAMAEYLAGSEELFVEQMNAKAKELLTKHPEVTKYTTIYMDTLRNGESSLVNTNKLIRNYSGATGLKTRFYFSCFI